MKRDVDLIRQLMFDIERQGAECSADALRNAAAHEVDERTRYHVRLLIDSGLAKEIDRTSAGLPCVRLTNAGHEFLELCRGDDRWREAKWIVHEQTGGLSLTVLRAVLTQWAVEGVSRIGRRRRWRRPYRAAYEQDRYGREPIYREPIYGEPAYRVESYRYEREPYFDDDPVRLVRPRRYYREAAPSPERWDREPAGAEQLADEPLGISLPVHMI